MSQKKKEIGDTYVNDREGKERGRERLRIETEVFFSFLFISRSQGIDQILISFYRLCLNGVLATILHLFSGIFLTVNF